MMKKATNELLQALAVTAEITGSTFSEAAVRVMASDLAQFPERQVVAALLRCRRELRSTLTLAAILERIDDGRPGPDEAWALCKAGVGDERVTVVYTPEMKAAFFVACNLADDHVAARMAFLEKYRTELQAARSSLAPVTWDVCLGHDKLGREAAITEAVEMGKLDYQHAQGLLPHIEIKDPRLLKLIGRIGK